MEEKTESSVKNRQSRNTGNIGHTTYRTKTNKTGKKPTANFFKLMRNADPTNRDGPMCSRRINSYFNLKVQLFSQRTIDWLMGVR